jgi:hypothetical protein
VLLGGILQRSGSKSSWLILFSFLVSCLVVESIVESGVLKSLLVFVLPGFASCIQELCC